MAPSCSELEPPANPGGFTLPLVVVRDDDGTGGPGAGTRLGKCEAVLEASRSSLMCYRYLPARVLSLPITSAPIDESERRVLEPSVEDLLSPTSKLRVYLVTAFGTLACIFGGIRY